jgi:ABC-type lipoprotein export system ATPase subunit
MSETIVLQTNHICKSFHDPVTVQILKDITFSIRQGEFVSVTGKSGCGKSTLLYILSTMDRDYEGELLSGGEKQRVAIARALINDPSIVMCDEPTGNLDKKNSLIVFSIFKHLAEESQQTLLVVTHDEEFAKNSHRIIEMEDGRIIKQ